MILFNFKMLCWFAVENYPTFPVNGQSFQVLVECYAATKVCDLIHGICLVRRETFSTNHVQQSIRHRHLFNEYVTLGIRMLQAKTKSRDHSNAEICKETISHGFFRSSRRIISTELRGWSIKTTDLGAWIWQIPHTFNVFMLEDRSEGFPRTQITKSFCACDCGR